MTIQHPKPKPPDTHDEAIVHGTATQPEDFPRLVYLAPYFEQAPLAELFEPAVIEAAKEILPPLVQPAADQAAAEAVAELAVMRVGDTMTGPLFLSDLIPIQDSQAAPKHYVDAMGAAGLSHALLDDHAPDGGGGVASDDGIINARDYGAKADGVTDDAAAIQAALDDVPSTGGTVLLPGMCLINAPVRIKSLTRLTGVGPGSGLLGGASLPTTDATGQSANGSMLCNKNYTATVLTDHDITVENMTLDFGAHTNDGAAHAIRFYQCSNVTIDQVTFQCRRSGDAVALIGCNNTLIESCSAFDWSNCAYDHWWAPKNARVIGCYGKTGATAQFVNFNPEKDATTGTGFIADTFVMTGCTFECTDTAGHGVQLEPLGSGTFVRNVIVSGNTFRNVWLLLRGAVSGAVVSGNTFLALRGGWPAIVTLDNAGGSPADIVVTGNVIEDPDSTTAYFSAVLDIRCDRAIVTSNRISGTGFTAPALNTDVYTTTVVGNSFPSTATVNTPGAAPGSNGLKFGSVTASATTNLGKHLDIYGGVAGLNYDGGGSTNLCGNTGGVSIYSGGVRSAVFTDQGIIGTNIGTVAPGTGGFSTLKATSGLGVWGATPPGAKPARPVTLADVINVLVSYGMTA